VIDSCNYLTLKPLCDSNSYALSVQRSDVSLDASSTPQHQHHKRSPEKRIYICNSSVYSATHLPAVAAMKGFSFSPTIQYSARACIVFTNEKAPTAKERQKLADNLMQEERVKGVGWQKLTSDRETYVAIVVQGTGDSRFKFHKNVLKDAIAAHSLQERVGDNYGMLKLFGATCTPLVCILGDISTEGPGPNKRKTSAGKGEPKRQRVTARSQKKRSGAAAAVHSDSEDNNDSRVEGFNSSNRSRKAIRAAGRTSAAAASSRSDSDSDADDLGNRSNSKAKQSSAVGKTTAAADDKSEGEGTADDNSEGEGLNSSSSSSSQKQSAAGTAAAAKGAINNHALDTICFKIAAELGHADPRVNEVLRTLEARLEAEAATDTPLQNKATAVALQAQLQAVATQLGIASFIYRICTSN
jgi:hypothetical protein